MAYQVTVEKRAEKYLQRLPPKRYQKISDVIHKLKSFPIVNADVVPLKGKYKGKSFRLRVGGWRVLFTVDEKGKTIRVWKIDTRGDIY